jgi:hypothetical protein
MKPHKWAKEIKAWADGAEIEEKLIIATSKTWKITHNPEWNHEKLDFRIKPQPKEPQYLYVYYGGMTDAYTYFVSKADPTMMRQYEYIGKIKLEQDDE